MKRPQGTVGMRQILCVTRVADAGTVTRAAVLLRKSQGAVSKAVAQVERVLGARLFAGARGQMAPTAAGKLVVTRFRAIETLAAAAALEHEGHARGRAGKRSPVANHFLANASTKRLRQLVALLDLGSIEAAAARLGVSRHAVHKSLREAEHVLEVPLFHHLAAGRFVATPRGRTLLTRIRLMLAEMRHAQEDVAELRGRTEGRLTVGCLPSMASHIVPDATAEVLRRAPQLSVALVEGSYDELMEGLRSGEVDVIVGGLAPAREFPDVRTIPLIDDRIVIFGRAGHPLARRRKLSSADFKAIRWVLPMRRSLPQPAFESLLAQAGIRPALPIVENASIAALNGLLATSDMLTVGSALQMRIEEQRGVLTEIPFRLTSEIWQTGIVLRESTAPSPAARLFVEVLESRVRRSKDG
ncbi:MAG: LysR substrate-binding domain-containing protein [Gammaproteobacteria bacterium]